jgi:imidazolonepropionase-like amidohydrolase
MTSSRPLVIQNGTVLDGTGAAPREATTIVVEGERLRTIGPASQVPTPPNAEVVDARGKWVIPGLIDMHVHVALSGEEDALLEWLAMGVTTIRDVGGNVDVLVPLREALARGEKEGARIVTYGPMLDGSPPIFAGRRNAMLPVNPLTRVLESAEQAEATCEELLEKGVEGFKLYAGLRPDLVRAFIRKVDGRVPVTGHLGRTWASEAIEAGINCLEHVHATCYQDVAPPEYRHGREDGNGVMPNYWTWLNTGWAKADINADYVNRFVELLVARDVCLSPTTVLITGGMATREALDEPGLKYTPPGLAERRRQQAEQMQRMREEAEREGRPLPPVQTVDPEIGQRARENELLFLKKVYDAGGKLVPSTDCGAAPNQVPGFSLHRELALFSEAGIPNPKVIELATRMAATVMLKQDDFGTLEAGKRADLLVLAGNPLDDIQNTRKLEAIVKDGRVYASQPLLDRVMGAAAG